MAGALGGLWHAPRSRELLRPERHVGDARRRLTTRVLGRFQRGLLTFARSRSVVLTVADDMT
jgi:hypothetical protein